MLILEFAEPRPHDVMLVTAAAGGIGTLLVQAGGNVGARVVAVAGGDRMVARRGLITHSRAVAVHGGDEFRGRVSS
ncbi:MAG: hypothetical protein ACRD0U_10935 [Acidimicrobiales bacterium]